MEFLRIWMSRCAGLFGRKRLDADLDEELRAHIELAAEENVQRGMEMDEARRTALRDFGGVTQTKEAFRAQRGLPLVETVAQDARYGLRQLRRNPGFTTTAVITLGLGIGATTAIFSAVYSMILRPLAYPDSARLMWVTNEWPKAHIDRVISPNFVAAKQTVRAFEQLGAYIYSDGNLTGAGNAVRVTHAAVTANFLSMLGAEPQLGRGFTAADGDAAGTNVVLLSDRLWRDHFQANRKIVGSRITVDGVAQTVIGVMPAQFRFPDIQLEPDIYSPLNIGPSVSLAADKRVLLLNVIGKLRHGVTEQQAQAEMSAFFLARTRSYPAGFAQMAEGQQTSVEALRRHLTGDNRKPLLILLASVGVVLLIACANVANLQLARAVTRRQEIALRGALGASRMRLVRQSLVESLLLSMFSAVLGFGIAFVMTALMRHAQMPDALQAALYSRAAQMLRLPFGKLSASIEVGGWVLAFTTGLALLTTLLFGLIPAVTGTRTELRNALQAAALRITSGREQRALRSSLLVAEVGLAVVLLASAGLLIRSFVHVLEFDSGFDAKNTLTGITLLDGTRYSNAERMNSFVNRLLPRLQSMPGVKAAALTTVLPVQPYDLTSAVTFEGVPAPPAGARPNVAVVSVTPDYFRAVGASILQGRAFSDSDTATSAPVTIVNRAFATRFLGGDALGKRFHSMAWGADHEALTVVGIAEDVRHGGLEQEVQPEMLVPMAQLPQTTLSVALRTTENPDALANSLRTAVAAVDAEEPVFDIETMDHRVSEAVAQRRMTMLLIACFAMVAVILSAVGVYGVFSYSVTQRTHEMGIRLSLGASRGGLLKLVVMEAARLIAVGGIFGVCTALALSRVLASMLVGVTPHDGFSFSFAWLFMTVVALLASTIPAAHAARTDLISVLHTE